MDALMAALVAAALAQWGEKTAWLAAILADRFRPRVVIAGAAVALAANYALAAAAGSIAAPMLTPEAKLLLLGSALVIAGSAAPFAPKRPDPIAGWRLGGFATAALGLSIMAFGDSVQLLTAALAARSPVAPLAGVGATLGSLAVVAPAALLGEAGWRRLPLSALRWGAGALLIVTGLTLALSGLRLI